MVWEDKKGLTQIWAYCLMQLAMPIIKPQNSWAWRLPNRSEARGAGRNGPESNSQTLNLKDVANK